MKRKGNTPTSSYQIFGHPSWMLSKSMVAIHKPYSSSKQLTRNLKSQVHIKTKERKYLGPFYTPRWSKTKLHSCITLGLQQRRLNTTCQLLKNAQNLDTLVTMLYKMRKANLPLAISTIQPIVRGNRIFHS